VNGQLVLRCRQADFAIYLLVTLTVNGAPDLRDALVHDVPVPHGDVIRRDRDRGLARQSIPLATRRLCPTKLLISKLTILD